MRTQLLRMLKARIGLCRHDGRPPLPPSRTCIPGTQVWAGQQLLLSSTLCRANCWCSPVGGTGGLIVVG